MDPKFLSDLENQINRSFNLDEIKKLCFDLGVEYENLGGETKRTKIRELIQFMIRRDKLELLIQKCKEERPNADWPNIPEKEKLGLDTTPPFKGLQNFTEYDENIFFGREKLIDKLVKHLSKDKFLAVVGASGSGKSSLLQAGLVPAVRRGEIEINNRKSNTWIVKIVTPGLNPINELAAKLTNEVEKASKLAKVMREDNNGLDLWIRSDDNLENHLFLIIDQFEEVFTLCEDEEERQTFVDNLLKAVNGGSEQLSLVIAMRADFYPHATEFEELRLLLEDQQIIIGPMSREELQQTMVGPAEKKQFQFEPTLIDHILDDVDLIRKPKSKPEPGALPLLSHALLETWNKRDGELMTFTAYQSVGGIEGAIAKTAESVYSKLSIEEQTYARNIFLRLTRSGEGTLETRIPIKLSDLLTQGEQPDLVIKVLRQLSDSTARLLTINEDVVEVSHEALLRKWPRLQQWLESNRESLIIHGQLQDRVQQWKERGDDGFLYRGMELAQAEKLKASDTIKLTKSELEFIDSSIKQRRKAKLFQWVFIVIGIFLIIAIVATILATEERQNANNSEATAIVLLNDVAEGATLVAQAVQLVVDVSEDNPNIEQDLLPIIFETATARAIELAAVLPTPANTQIPTSTPTFTLTPSPTPTSTPTPTSSPTRTPTSTPTYTSTPTPTPSRTLMPSPTLTPSPTQSGIGRILFTLSGLLMTTDPLWSSAEEIGTAVQNSCSNIATTPSGDSFSLYRGTRCEIHQLNTCGSPNRQNVLIITPEGDRAKINYRPVGEEGFGALIFDVRLNQSELIQWSPLSNQFLFVELVGEINYLIVGDLLGNRLRSIPSVSQPSYSPDGNFIVYRKPVGPAINDIFVLDIASGAETNVTNNNTINKSCPSWVLEQP